MEILNQIRQFLDMSGWVHAPYSVSFLAAGEYNANWRVDTPEGPRVLRINHGSQLGLGDGQINYEYRVLKALSASGVTPKPLACHQNPEPLGGGALLMEYLPGRALDYRKDLDHAAWIFARVHTIPVVESEGFIVQADPVMDIARESLGLIHRFFDHPLQKEKDLLLDYHDSVVRLGHQNQGLFENEPMCIVNTEVNSGNFLIHSSDDATGSSAFLVDWEKAVISYRYQDLGHFLVPTTTLWKTDVCLLMDEKKAFLKKYHQAAGLTMDMETLCEKTWLMERVILLRALSWCFMAWYEYTREDRILQNPDTFSKIKAYLSDIPWILNSVA